MELHTTLNGETITIRPIRITDMEMEADFIRRLSLETKHYRFFGGVKELPPREIAHLCDVDGKHSMAFVATIRRGDQETEIGVARYSPDSRSDVREIAVTVADEWQQTELGAALMRRLIQSAQANGVKQLYSIELSDNAAMRALAIHLGMDASDGQNDPHQTIYSLRLS